MDRADVAWGGWALPARKLAPRGNTAPPVRWSVPASTMAHVIECRAPVTVRRATTEISANTVVHLDSMEKTAGRDASVKMEHHVTLPPASACARPASMVKNVREFVRWEHMEKTARSCASVKGTERAIQGAEPVYVPRGGPEQPVI